MIYLLIALYPREWRQRYGLEVLAHYQGQHLPVRDALDLVAGALDAHLHPQWRPRAPNVAAPLALIALLTLLQLAFYPGLAMLIKPGFRPLGSVLPAVFIVVGAVVWAVVFAVPARRRWPLPVALGLGLAFDLLFLNVLAPVAMIPWGRLVGPLAWAVILTAVIASPRRRRRGGRPWKPDDPAAGARMPRKPYDPDPEPLEAVGQFRR
ncbi:MAG TPA: hypothetical protein VF160_16690 [Candidatus Dormibacteraeota bacterium]